MCDFIFEHRERQRKKHFCLLRCLSAFATPIKLYFRCVFKLLPYVALALGSRRFFDFTHPADTGCVFFYAFAGSAFAGSVSSVLRNWMCPSSA